MNLFTPERGQNESFDAYKARRLQAKEAVRVMCRGPKQPPAVSKFDQARFFLGQHTNATRNLIRRQTANAGGRRQARRGLREWKLAGCPAD